MKPHYLFQRKSQLYLLLTLLCFLLLSSCQQNENNGTGKIDASVILLSATYTVKNSKGIMENRAGTGSAFSINNQGYFVTNFHVVREVIKTGKLEAIESVSPIKKTHPVEVVFFSAEKDLAIVKVKAWQRSPLKLADSEKVKITQTVYSVGFPGAAIKLSVGTPELTIPNYKDGTISARRSFPLVQNANPLHIFEHNAHINPGNSGGPLIDECNRVIGVNTFNATSTVDMAQIKTSKTGVLKVDVPAGIFLSSQINELKELLKQEKIEFLEDDSPCSANQLTNLYIAGLSIPIYILIAIIFAVIIVIFFVLRKQIKKDQIDERDLSIKINEKINKYADNKQPHPSSDGENKGPMRGKGGEILDDKNEIKQSKTITLQPEKNCWPKITLAEGKHVKLSRDPDAEVSFTDRIISRPHAELHYTLQGVLQVSDSGSSNGTYIDNEKLPSNTWKTITPGQRLILGSGDEKVVYRII